MGRKKRKKGKSIHPKKLAFNRRNWIVLLIGIITIVLGFGLLSKGSMILAPILLVLGYCVVVPMAILMK